MFERFNDRARGVLAYAQEEARLLDHDSIGTEHLLLALIHEHEGLAAKALNSIGVTLEAVREKVMTISDTEGSNRTKRAAKGSPPFTPRLKRVLELSLREALQLGHSYIGTEHMLLGIVREREGIAAQVLQILGHDLSTVRQQVIVLLSGRSNSRTVHPRRPIDVNPFCSYCHMPLEDNLRYRQLSMEGEGQAERISIRLVYCAECGTAIGKITI